MRIDLTDPRTMLLALDVAGREAELVAMTRRTYAASSFLDHRAATRSAKIHRVPLETLLDGSQTIANSRRPVRWIFHTAFCGSTLLSRCFDRPGRCLGYREPLALTHTCMTKPDLFSTRTVPHPYFTDEEWSRLLGVVVGLYSRTFEPGELSLIKPNEVCNALLAELLAVRGVDESRALFLYCDLRSFLCSTLKSAKRREWVRAKLRGVAAIVGPANPLAGIAVEGLDDPRAAAYLWVWQISSFARAAERPDVAERIRSLDCESLFRDPNATLRSCSRFLGLPFNARELRSIAEGPQLRSYSKSGSSGGLLARLGLARGRRYGADDRRAELDRVARDHATEVAAGLAWADQVREREGVTTDVPLSV